MRVRTPAAIPADPLLAFGVLTVLLMIVAAGFVGPLSAVSPDLDLDVGPLLPTGEPTPANTEPAQDEARELPEVAARNVPFAIFTILLFICIFLFIRFLLSLRRERLQHTGQPRYIDGFRVPDSSEIDRRTVVGRLKLAEAELSGPTNSRDAVISCWLALENATEVAGAGRSRQETTSEYAAHVLATFRAPAADLAFLQHLYQRARFGGGTGVGITGSDLGHARVCLRRIITAVENALASEERTVR